MANIHDKLNKIISAIFGKDVRQALYDGLDAINKEAESTTARQDYLDRKYNEQIKNMTLESPSDAEIVDARVGENGSSFEKLGDRLDNFDSQLEQNKTKIEKNFNSIENIEINKQEKIDENLNTTSKEIVPAINEVNDLEVVDAVSEITFAHNINKNGRNSLIKDKRGMVVLELSVKYGSGNTNGIVNSAVFATLPEGYRPKQKIERPGYVYNTNSDGGVFVSNFRINTDGTIFYNVSHPTQIVSAVNMAELAVVYYV